MGKAVALRRDYDAAMLRALARASHHAGQTRRLLALAAVYEGASRSAAAALGGVTLQMVRDWVVKFNAGGPERLIEGKAPGPEPLLNDEQRKALAVMIEAGPIPAAHGVVRWRLVDLCQWVFETLRISLSQQTLSREVRAMGKRCALGPPQASCAGGGRHRGF